MEDRHYLTSNLSTSVKSSLVPQRRRLLSPFKRRTRKRKYISISPTPRPLKITKVDYVDLVVVFYIIRLNSDRTHYIAKRKSTLCARGIVVSDHRALLDVIREGCNLALD